MFRPVDKMARQTERLIYELAQRARATWYMGHYEFARRTAPRTATPAPAGPIPDRKAILDDLAALFRQDWANIEAGHYRAPYDLLPRPLQGLGRSLRFLQDLPAVHRRRRERVNDEVFRAPHRGRYPRYYLQNFHFQSDGYLSRESARLYDHQVETLFSGGADAMRRQALVPIGRFLSTHGARRSRLLDVACGTGRFLTFVKDNHPRLDVTGLDLSHPYLAEARHALRRWSWVRLLQGNAETLPFADGAFDLVTTVYLFHELPKKVRRTVAAELARVVRPGGQVIFVDSIQRGDWPAYDHLLDRFPIGYHEPYYKDYVRDDLDALFSSVGLTPLSVERAFFSRVMVLERR